MYKILSGPWYHRHYVYAWYKIILSCASYFSVGGSEWLLDSVLHLPLTPRRRRRFLSYEMRAWPANTGTSTTPIIIQFFIISFYTISDMIEGLPSDNNVDLSFWQAACCGHLMYASWTRPNQWWGTCVNVCVLIAHVNTPRCRNLRLTRINYSSALSDMRLLVDGFNARGLSVKDRFWWTELMMQISCQHILEKLNSLCLLVYYK